MVKKLDRRGLIRQGGLFGLGSVVASSALGKECGVVTPAQTEGPFYPVESQMDTDIDLTYVKGHVSYTAKGQKIHLSGRVLDSKCQPVVGALVEIWQACASGKYNHPRDPNPAELDKHFQYWGRTHTNEKGEYFFLTIRPGQYPATADWMRPAHIHFKVMAPGEPTLTTQMYFPDDELNSADGILNTLSEKEKEVVTMRFVDGIGKGEDEGQARKGNFDIYLATSPELN